MSFISTYLAGKILNAVLADVPYSSPSTVYVGLHIADPTDSTTVALSNEVVGNGYSRQVGDFEVVVSGSVTTNSTVITFPVATPSGYGNVGWASIWDAPTGGNLLFHYPINPTWLVPANDQIQFPIGSLSIQLN
jgi:hypothetical protein